eukprot:g5380.t1
MLSYFNTIYDGSSFPPSHSRWSSNDSETNTSDISVPDLKSIKLNKLVLEITKSRETSKSHETEITGENCSIKVKANGWEEELERSLDRLCILLRSKLDTIDHVNVVTMLHELGNIATESNLQSVILAHPLLKELFGLIPKYLNSFEAFHVANLIRTMARLGKGSLHVQFGEASSGFHVMESLLTRAIHIVSTFQPKLLAQLSHSLAQLDFVGAKEMLPLLAVVAKSQLSGFVPRDISVFLYSLALMNYEDHVGLLPPLVVRLESSVELVDKPQQISNSIWALSKLHYDPIKLIPLVEKMTKWSEDHLQEFQVFEAENYLSGLVKLRFNPGDTLLNKLDTFVRANGKIMPPRVVSLLLSACADLHHVSNPLLDLVDAITFTNEDEVPALVTRILWSCTMMNKLSLDRIYWAASHLKNYPINVFSRANLIQIAQAIITFQLEHEEPDIMKILPEQLAKTSLYLWYEIQLNGGIPSNTQSFVYALYRLGYNCEARLVGDASLNITAGMSPSGTQFAIEVTNPLRCFINEPNRFLGRALWRGQILKSSNWKILRIPHISDWSSWDPERQVMYLKSLIDQQILNTLDDELPLVN